jgi:serine/threonine-protein kinase
LIQRAQERLPGEALLLQLKADAEAKRREQAAKKLVEKTSLHVYNVFLTSPQEALTAVHQALEQMPGEPRLIALEGKVVEQLKKANAGELKLQYLKRAQACIDAKQFGQASQILESAAIECGESPEITSLLTYAQEQRRSAELGQKAANATRDAQPLMAVGEFEAAIALLQPIAAETNDPSVEQLLRQATSNQAELVRRVDAVVARGVALSEKDIEKAAEFLISQPQDIQKNPRVREFSARLNSAIQREQSITRAIEIAIAALQRRDLRNGLDELESAQRTLGDAPRLSTAITEYKSKRTQIANQLLNAAVESATQAIQAGDRPRAAESLTAVADAAEFADSGLQANVKRLAKDAGAPPPQKRVAGQKAPAVQQSTVAVTAKAKSGLPIGLLIGALAVVLLAAAGAAYWFLRPAPVVPLGALELNATPFAEIVSVTSDKGKVVVLPAGDHWTPFRLDDVPWGRYTVGFKGPAGNTQQQQCDVAQSAQICTIELKPIDDSAIDQIVGATK